MPHVVVVDTVTSDLSPAAIVRFFRSAPELPAPRLIGVAAGLTDAQGQGMLQAGLDAFLRKPFDVRTLIRLIEKSDTPSRVPQLV